MNEQQARELVQAITRLCTCVTEMALAAREQKDTRAPTERLWMARNNLQNVLQETMRS